MGKLLSIAEAAKQRGVSEVRLRVLCRDRRIKGARNVAGRWFVPADFSVEPAPFGPPLGKVKGNV